MDDEKNIETEEIKKDTFVESDEPVEEKNWLDKLCEWGHNHPVAIALIVILCPFGLLWLGTLIGRPSADSDDTESIPDDTTGMKAIPVDTITTTHYKWVADEDNK